MTFGALFNQVTGFLDKRFLVTYFLPSLVFWGLLIVVWFAGQGHAAAAAGLWENGQGIGWIIRLIGFFGWLVLFANVLASQSMTVFRMYEGYWNFPGASPFRSLGQKWHQNRLAQIASSLATEPRRYQEIYFGYPLPSQTGEVMPTRLGNIMKNAELYPRDRYSIDAVLIWPRLYNIFPQAFADAIVELRTGLDFMLVISALSVVFAFISGIYLLAVGASSSLFLLCFVGGLVAAYIAYQAALGGAVLYAQQIKVAFDIYRNALLTKMRVPLPSTLAEERTTWAELCLLLYRNIPPSSWSYGTDDAVAPVSATALDTATVLDVAD